MRGEKSPTNNNNSSNKADPHGHGSGGHESDDLFSVGWGEYHGVLEDWQNEFLQSHGGLQANDLIPSKASPTATATAPQDAQRRKVSDAVVYGPRFYAIYDAYKTALNIEIDTTRNLMSLCLEHIVPFVKWMRENDTQMQFVNKTLLENDYLRCEVRNGAVMVLIYVFAAVKASNTEGSDIFLTLQDPDTGLGIANRFSLKIYNDPYNYLMFLKSTLSALIDAGAIPDNERINQPKRTKLQMQNREELQAFGHIQIMLVAYLESANFAAARNIVHQVLVYWQFRGKYMRHRRFVGALQMLRAKAPDSLEQQQQIQTLRETRSIDSETDSDNEHDETMSTENSEMLGSKRSYEEVYSPMEQSMINVNLSSGQCDSNVSSNQSSKRTTFVNKFQMDSMTERAQLMAIAAAAEAEQNQSQSPPPSVTRRQGFSALRFERIGLNEWEIKETKIYDLDSFINMYLSFQSAIPLMLVDEFCLQGEFTTMRLEAAKGRMVSLESELRKRRSLVSSWPLVEIQQFRDFIAQWEEQSSSYERSNSSGNMIPKGRSRSITKNLMEQPDRPVAPQLSLLAYWRQQQQQQQQQNNNNNQVEDRNQLIQALQQSIQLGRGLIAYEMVVNVGILVRANEQLGLKEDMWCKIYPSELHAAEEDDQAFGFFLQDLFPQLLVLDRPHALTGEVMNKRLITLKYYGHKLESVHLLGNRDPGLEKIVDGIPSVPARAQANSYQTVGTLQTASKRVISRLISGQLFHDFILEYIA